MSNRNYIQPENLNPRQSHHVSSDTQTIQSLLSDNQRLAASHVALKQELNLALQDVRHFSNVANKIKSDRDAEIRGVFEKAVKMENEVRLVDEMSADLVQVKSDVGKLSLERSELNGKMEEVSGELEKLGAKGERVREVMGEVEAIRSEVRQGRAAVEYEKRVYASNIEQGKAMERSMISMAQEIEKLKVELADAEKRAEAAAADAEKRAEAAAADAEKRAEAAAADADKRAKAAAAAAATNTPGTVYASGYVNHDQGYGVNAYPNPYAGYQVQGVVDPQYGSGPVPVPVPYAPYPVHKIQQRMVNPQYGGPGVVPNGLYNVQHPNNAHGQNLFP